VALVAVLLLLQFGKHEQLRSLSAKEGHVVVLPLPRSEALLSREDIRIWETG
jgi:hypothetical protein